MSRADATATKPAHGRVAGVTSAARSGTILDVPSVAMRLPLAALALVALAPAACGPAEPAAEVAEAELTSDAIDAAVTESSFLLTVLRAADEPAPDLPAARRGLLRARDQLQAFWGPCATLQVDEPERRVVAQLRRCTGAGELRAVTGTVSYTFAPATGGVQVQVSARDVKVGPATVELLEATAVLRLASALREVRISQSHLVYTGGLGRHVDSTLTREAVTTWNVLSNCYAHSGGRRVTTTEADGGASGYALEVDGYQRCARQCPRAAMDVVVLTSLDGARSLRASYNGLATARWVLTVNGARAAAGTWRLDCT